MTTGSYPEKFYVLDRLDQHFEMMSQICQIHVEFHVAFVRSEATRNVVQDMTCMVSFESIFHQECVYCGLWGQKQCFRTQIHRFEWGYQSSQGCERRDKSITYP